MGKSPLVLVVELAAETSRTTHWIALSILKKISLLSSSAISNRPKLPPRRTSLKLKLDLTLLLHLVLVDLLPSPSLLPLVEHSTMHSEDTKMNSRMDEQNINLKYTVLLSKLS